MRIRIHKDEKGYVVVETLGSLIPFLLMVAAILLFITIVATQAKVHYALTQTAEEMSIYQYYYEKNASERDFANKLINIVNGSRNFGSISNNKANANLFSKLNEPDSLSCAEFIFDMYMNSGNKNTGANDFKLDCKIEDGDITLTVEYKIDFRLFSIWKPMDFLTITQTAKTKTWVGGNGKGYNHYMGISGDGSDGAVIPDSETPPIKPPPATTAPATTAPGATKPDNGAIAQVDLYSIYYYPPLNKLPYRNYYDTDRLNCTFYCYGRYMEKTGNELNGCVGNAGNWLSQAEANGIPIGSEVRSDSIAVFTGGYGHVVYIEEVFIDENGKKMINFSECNWGTTEDGVIYTMSYEDFISERGTPAGYIY